MMGRPPEKWLTLGVSIKIKPFSPQRMQRKSMRVFLCVLRVLCGESVFSVLRTNLP